MTKDDKKKADTEKEYPTSAPPTWVAVATVITMLAVFIPNFPTLEQIDEIATVETFTARVFPEYLSIEDLAYARFAAMGLVLGVTIYSVFLQKGWEQSTNYLPTSKLKQTSIPFTGFRTQLPFTSWSWNLLGVSFGLTGYIAYATVHEMDIPVWLLRMALLVYETAAPQTLLVSTVVRYAIWPQVLKGTGNTSDLAHPRTLLWHNANSVLALIEVALLGGLPVVVSHVAIAPMFGIAYIFFSWAMAPYWRPQDGPQFIYFFMDTTVDNHGHALAIMALLIVLMVFYGLFAGASLVLEYMGSGILSHIVFVLVVSAGVTRFRD